MAQRFLAALILGLIIAPFATAQTVRFDTNVGNIDLILNPGGLPELRGHVDNILAYVEDGLYDNNVLNRADTGADPDDPTDDFVLQFGGFSTDKQVFSSFNDFESVENFEPVIVDFDGDGTVDFNTEELNNTRGEVSLALSNNPNTGTNSFFVNLGDNSGLDNSGFVPFATIADMSTVDYIMLLNQVSDPSAGLAGSNIPIINDDDLLVFVERAFVLDENPVVPVASITDASLLLTPEELGSSTSEDLTVTSVPEPASAAIALAALMVLAAMRGSRI
jgi:cyclophilin family peptidyl-prolyl cis-trans isomerase